MKNFQKVFVALALLLGSQNVFAGPTIEPGPVMRLDANAVELLEVLSKNTDKFSEFASQGDLVSIGATVQHLNPDVSRFVVTGAKLVQGDIISGSVTLKIVRTRHKSEMSFPQPYYYTYAADISVQE